MALVRLRTGADRSARPRPRRAGRARRRQRPRPPPRAGSGRADTGGAARTPRATAVKRIERWGLLTQAIEVVFQGLSLASILLLMALGLAIVFGLMGVINMAHGELMALGAYTTFVVQGWFAAHAPAPSTTTSWWRCPLSFLVAGAAGFVLERCVIRFLYGRPLETLLLTWGVSLIIQQGLRLWFGAANVDVTAPRWLSGGIPVMAGVQLPYNRLFIIGLAAVVRGRHVLPALPDRRGAAHPGGHAEPRDGRVPRRARALGGRRHVRARRGARRARRVRDHPDRQRGAGARPELHRRLVHGGGDRRRGQAPGSILAATGIGGLNKLIEPGLGAVFGKVAHPGPRDRLHPAPAVRACSRPRGAMPTRERWALAAGAVLWWWCCPRSTRCRPARPSACRTSR